MKLNQGGKAKVHVKQLMQEGYKFAYHTNRVYHKIREKYIFCYDQGFLEIESGMLALVVKQDYNGLAYFPDQWEHGKRHHNKKSHKNWPNYFPVHFAIIL